MVSGVQIVEVTQAAMPPGNPQALQHKLSVENAKPKHTVIHYQPTNSHDPTIDINDKSTNSKNGPFVSMLRSVLTVQHQFQL